MTRTAKRQRNKNLNNHRKLPKVNYFFYLEIHSEILLKFSYIENLSIDDQNQKGTKGKSQIISYVHGR